MKVGFRAYAVGVLFMDSLLSIISIIPWIFRQPVSCCVTENVGNAKARSSLPGTISTSLGMQSINMQWWEPGLQKKVTGWLNAWSSQIYSQSDHPLKEP